MGYQILMILVLLACLVGGIQLLRTWDETTSSNSMGRRETPGELSYNKMQFVVLWLLGMKLLLWMAFAIDFSR